MTVVNIKDTGGYLLASEQGVKAIFSDVDILNSAIKQSIARDWLSTIFIRYEEPRLDNTRDFDSSNQSVDGWLSRVREKLYAIPSVEDIFFSIEGSDVDVWVVIPERNLNVLHQIVEREWELTKILVSGEKRPFLVDFHIIYRYGRNVKDFAPTRAIKLLR